jgi:hypothetical protein
MPVLTANARPPRAVSWTVSRRRLLPALAVAAVLTGTGTAAAAGTAPEADRAWLGEPAAAAAVDRSVLGAVARDLGLSLMTRPDEPMVRLPLVPHDWSLWGRVQPYAALSPRVVRPAVEDGTGLTGPVREYRDDLSRGVHLGSGVNWRISDRVEMFGEYFFLPRAGGGAAPPTSRDLDPPELKGGFSIKF